MKQLTEEQLKFVTQSSVILEPRKSTDAVYEQHFEIGAVGTTSKDWRSFLPAFENQRSTYDCTAFSCCNQYEILAKEQGEDLNFSDLYLSVISGNSQRGNGMTQAYDAFRKKGVVLEEFCTYDPDMLTNPAGTWSRRQQKVNAVPAEVKRYLGTNYSQLNIKNEAVAFDALNYSPLRVAVGLNGTWFNGGIVPKCTSPTAYHACLVVYIDAQCYYVYDSVNSQIVRLAKNYEFMSAFSIRELPADWKTVHEEYVKKEITTEMIRIAWLNRKDLRDEFPASNKLVKVGTQYTIYDWAADHYDELLLAQQMYNKQAVKLSGTHYYFLTAPESRPITSLDELARYRGSGDIKEIDPMDAKSYGIDPTTGIPLYEHLTWWEFTLEIVKKICRL